MAALNERLADWTKRPTAVELPVLGETVYIRPLSARTVLGWADADNVQASAEIVCASMCDVHGEPLAFTIDEVLEWPAVLFQTVCTAALKLNGLSDSPELRVGN